MTTKDFTETFSNILEKSMVDREANVVRRVCIMRPESRNNRVYSEKAMSSIRRLSEGAKSFLDHGDLISGGQSVLKLLGAFSNPRKENGVIYADLKVLKESAGRELFFDICENHPSLAGFSIAGRGRFADQPDAEGREQVENVEILRSIDFVAEPAVTIGVFESQNDEGSQEDIENLKLENLELKKQLEDLRDQIRQKDKVKGA